MKLPGTPFNARLLADGARRLRQYLFGITATLNPQIADVHCGEIDFSQADRALPGTASRVASHRVAPRSAAAQSPLSGAARARHACGVLRNWRPVGSLAEVLAAVRLFLNEELPQAAKRDP